MTAHLVWSGKSQANINMKGVEEVNDGCIAIDADGAIVTSSVSHPQAQKRENVSTAGWVQKTAREQTHEADLAPSPSLFFIAFHFSRTHTHTCVEPLTLFGGGAAHGTDVPHKNGKCVVVSATSPVTSSIGDRRMESIKKKRKPKGREKRRRNGEEEKRKKTNIKGGCLLEAAVSLPCAFTWAGERTSRRS